MSTSFGSSLKTMWMNFLGNFKHSAHIHPLLPKPGLYHYLHERENERVKIHLRIDPTSTGNELYGTLLVNANRVFHLNPTATLMAFWSLEQQSGKQITNNLSDIFNVSSEEARNDYAQFANQFEQLFTPGNQCPIHHLNIETTPPFTAQPTAPYRMDLAVTYRCNNDCHHCYNARPRSYPELSTEKWKCIIDDLWNIGIPHVVFTGGEPTLREDLTNLIKYASQTGLVTGLNTNGRILQNKEYVDKLVNAGLDHIQITIESHDLETHNKMVQAKDAWHQTISGLQNSLDSPLFVMTNTTMLRDNYTGLEETLIFLAKQGVPTVGLNALIYSGRGRTVGTGLNENELSPLLETARSVTSQNNQRLIWYTPTQYCKFDPMQLELGVKSCTAARYNMCIEPDGAIIPCQSYYCQLGNILNTPWDEIWHHKISNGLRGRDYIQEKCKECVLLSECGGGCPLTTNAPDTMDVRQMV